MWGFATYCTGTIVVKHADSAEVAGEVVCDPLYHHDVGPTTSQLTPVLVTGRTEMPSPALTTPPTQTNGEAHKLTENAPGLRIGVLLHFFPPPTNETAPKFCFSHPNKIYVHSPRGRSQSTIVLWCLLDYCGSLDERIGLDEASCPPSSRTCQNFPWYTHAVPSSSSQAPTRGPWHCLTSLLEPYHRAPSIQHTISQSDGTSSGTKHYSCRAPPMHFFKPVVLCAHFYLHILDEHKTPLKGTYRG